MNKIEKLIDDEFLNSFTTAVSEASVCARRMGSSLAELKKVWNNFPPLESKLEIHYSKYCYKKIMKAVGLKSKFKPNTRRPLYKNKIVTTPTVYKIGNKIICHPLLKDRLLNGKEIDIRIIPKTENFDLYIKPMEFVPDIENDFKVNWRMDWGLGIYNKRKNNDPNIS